MKNKITFLPEVPSTPKVEMGQFYKKGDRLYIVHGFMDGYRLVCLNDGFAYRTPASSIKDIFGLEGRESFELVTAPFEISPG